MTATGSSLPQSAPSVPIGTFLLLALSAVFYLWLMVDLTGPQGGSGAGVDGAGVRNLFSLTFFLWIALAVLLIAGGVMGKMPRWVAILALAPSTRCPGSAPSSTIDMLSRHAVWALAFPALLPLLHRLLCDVGAAPEASRGVSGTDHQHPRLGRDRGLVASASSVSYWGPGTFGR